MASLSTGFRRVLSPRKRGCVRRPRPAPPRARGSGEGVEVPVDDLVAGQQTHERRRARGTGRTAPAVLRPSFTPLRAMTASPTTVPATSATSIAGPTARPEVDAHHAGELDVAHPHPARVGERRRAAGSRRRRPPRSGARRGRRDAARPRARARRRRPGSRSLLGMICRSRSISVTGTSSVTKARPIQTSWPASSAEDHRDEQQRGGGLHERVARARCACRSAGSGPAAAATRGPGCCRRRRSGVSQPGQRERGPSATRRAAGGR